MTHIADDRDHELADDHVEWPTVKLRRGILSEVGHLEKEPAARSIGRRGFVLRGVNRVWVDVHTEHGEPLLEEQPDLETPCLVAVRPTPHGVGLMRQLHKPTGRKAAGVPPRSRRLVTCGAPAPFLPPGAG